MFCMINDLFKSDPYISTTKLDVKTTKQNKNDRRFLRISFSLTVNSHNFFQNFGNTINFFSTNLDNVLDV